MCPDVPNWSRQVRVGRSDTMEASAEAIVGSDADDEEIERLAQFDAQTSQVLSIETEPHRVPARRDVRVRPT
jgi:hypothetical protein